MRFRKLRIVLCATCAIATVLLCMLWVRSYWWTDRVEGNLLGRNFIVTTAQSQFLLSTLSNVAPLRWRWHRQRLRGESMDLTLRREKDDEEGDEESKNDLYLVIPGAVTMLLAWNGTGVWVQLWLLALIWAAMGLMFVAPTPRFGLRTLLISTTLVSVVFGVAVYVGRK